MEFIEDKEVVVIFSKRTKLETVCIKLAELSGEQIYSFFTHRGIRLPRRFHCMAMIMALNERIKHLNSLSLSKDYFEKLQNYADFSEFQLQKLFVNIGTTEDFFEYRKNLWKLVFKNISVLNLLDGEAQYLLNLRKLSAEEFAEYSLYISKACLDLESDFDGIPKSKLLDCLMKTYTLDDIRLLARKYDILLPTRLKKDELLSYVKEFIGYKKRLTADLNKELNAMTVVQLNSFCQLHNLMISSNLKREELIFLFLHLIEGQNAPTLNLKGFVAPKEATPLSFTVDLDVIRPFGKGGPEKVIYYENQVGEDVIFGVGNSCPAEVISEDGTVVLNTDQPLESEKEMPKVESEMPMEEDLQEEYEVDDEVDENLDNEFAEEVLLDDVIEETALETEEAPEEEIEETALETEEAFEEEIEETALEAEETSEEETEETALEAEEAPEAETEETALEAEEAPEEETEETALEAEEAPEEETEETALEAEEAPEEETEETTPEIEEAPEDESYDPAFLAEEQSIDSEPKSEPLIKDEDLEEDEPNTPDVQEKNVLPVEQEAEESPYFRNKKIIRSKKDIIIPLVVVVAIVAILIGALFIIKLAS